MAGAQPIGRFRWQLRPFCNVVTLTVVQNNGVYTLDGYDDQCGGASPRSAVVGTAFPNPTGTIGMGFTIVTTPSGTPVHVDAAVTMATLGGTWRDSAGNTGPFVFTPGAPVAGGVRPAPRPVFPVGLSAGGTTITNVGSPITVTDAANRGYVDAAAPVFLALPGSGQSTALPAIQMSLAQATFSTPRAGHLKIDMAVSGGLGCTSDQPTRWWLELDGVAIRSSVRSVGHGTTGWSAAGLIAVSLTGITPGPIAAGSHTVITRLGCTSGTATVQTSSSNFAGSVTMLPAGYVHAADPPVALDQQTPPCDVQRRADGTETRRCQ